MRHCVSLVAAASILILTQAVQAQSDPPAKDSKATGKLVHIVTDRCPAGCEFTTWTAKNATVLRATPDEAAAVVTELAQGAKVEGVKLPDGTTGWAYRENFNGTEMPAVIIEMR